MTDFDRRGLIDATLATVAAAFVAAPAQAAEKARPKETPWIKRLFHLYTVDGLTRAELLPVPAPTAAETQQLLRRNVERLTLGGSAPGYNIDFHVANQPTLLIPLFGSIIIILADGTEHEFGHGDMAFAEDCTGKGHISRTGANGSFVVQIQFPKTLCPVTGSSDIAKLWREPA